MSICMAPDVPRFFLMLISPAMNIMFDIFRYLRPYLIMGAALSTILTGGCSSFPKKPAIDDAKVTQFAARGYDSGIEYLTSVSKISLNIGDECCRGTIVQPSRDGKYPLVIYLPGLGESSDAGGDMRRAWAKSGYAVLSVQPLKDDEDVWSSEAAHNADFAFIRHERYSAEVVSERLHILTRVIEDLKQRVVSADSGLQHLDLSHIAIIGFDIGASSAMIVAGENVPGVSFKGLSDGVNGIIALSPYADFSGSAFDVRYRNINVPVLSITSDADSDTHGSVPPSLHQAPFQYMPPVDKYLLLLSGAAHSVIGDGGTDNADRSQGDSHSEGSANGRANRSGRKSSTGGSDSRSHSRQEGVTSSTQRAMMEVVIEQVSTAFLNAYVKNDQFSLAWLKNDAQPWIDKVGQLKEK